MSSVEMGVLSSPLDTTPVESSIELLCVVSFITLVVVARVVVGCSVGVNGVPPNPASRAIIHQNALALRLQFKKWE